MLQVLLVKHSFGEGLAWEKAFMMFSCFMDFKHFVNIYLLDSEFVIDNYNLWILVYCDIINV